MAFTFFFRDINVIEGAVKILAQTLIGRSKPVIWVAGCATGQEPYTLAMVLAESMGRFAFRNIRIYATDWDEGGNFGKIIAEGVYSQEELKRIPPDFFKKYFVRVDDKNYQVIDSIKVAVHFIKHDLLSAQAAKEGCSLILCKNVLLHFNEAERVKVIKMFHAALAAGGLLGFENTQKMPGILAPFFEKQSGDAELYMKKEFAAVLA